MKVIDTNITDVKIVEPAVFGDERGFFMETWNQEVFDKTVTKRIFVQDNYSRSRKGILRGLHYQTQNTQGKLVRVTAGEVFDVAVDLRKTSKTFGEWVGVYLSAENKRQLWVPEGFAHGFLVVSESADFNYKTTNYYHPQSEKSLLWRDTDLKIDWPLDRLNGEPELADKDKEGIFFKDCQGF